MTAYLLRWQWLFLKRQLSSISMLVQLIISAFFQVILLASFLGSGSDYTSSITMVVLYTTCMTLGQCMNGFSQAQTVASMGLLGVAPIDHRPKMAMVAFNVTFIAALNAAFLALGMCASFMIHGAIAGALLVGLLVFVSGTAFFAGIAAGLTTWLGHLLPARMKKAAGTIMSPVMFLIVIIYPILEHRDPALIRGMGNLFMQPALHPAAAERQLLVFLFFLLVGVGVGVTPFAKQFSKFSNRLVEITDTDSRKYGPSIIPEGHLRSLIWMERIQLRRTKGAPLLSGAIFLVLIAVMPSDTPGGLWFLYLGLQFGFMLFSFAGPKGIPLVYLAPLNIKQWWYARMAILLTEAFAIAVLYLVTQVISHGPITVFTGIRELAMLVCGVTGTSFMAVIFPSSRYHAGQKQRRRKGFTTGIVIALVTSVVPIGLAFLNQKWPLIGFIVDLGIIVGVLRFGTRFLDEKTSVKYPLSS
ncbi:hypothetical protein [Alicyclobacillus dauci]|uniref:Membrane protein involved in the export of O-antigen and teichoic acid n=1 Tax=Alicyclobacillus dauci TaxID=1475485 RepID=A0ABY6Z390_9BACL|nr:hypothetical protein [Alicyclobacillus dauci]WAH37224.1 hypothetical protein NZD86_01355 [Alicyclobacillus dauci]